MEEVEGSPEKGAASGRDWTKGSVIRNLLSLSWPVVVSESLYLVTVVDMIWVGKLGAVSIAGVGVASIVIMLLMAGRFGLNVGAKAMVARFVGAGDVRGANHTAMQAFVTCGIYVTVMASIGIPFAKPILILMGLEADVVAEGAAYMRIQFLSISVMGLWMLTERIIQASGDTMTPMKITFIFRFVHLTLCPFLVLGWWVFPRLGVSGAAMANLTGYTVGMAIGLWVLFSGRTRLRLSLSGFRLDPNIIWRIVKIGIPPSIMGMQLRFGQLVLMRLMVPFGTLAVAGHSLIQRIEAVIDLPPYGVGSGASVLVGQNLGARQPERAERSGWLAVGLGQSFMIVCSLVILLWAENIIRIFNTEPALVEIASIFLRIAAAGYLVMGITVILRQCISGAGDTLPVLLAGLLAMWVVQIPLAFFLPRVTNLGVYGVRWGMVAGMVVGAVIYITYFRLGRWKRKKV